MYVWISAPTALNRSRRNRFNPCRRQFVTNTMRTIDPTISRIAHPHFLFQLSSFPHPFIPLQPPNPELRYPDSLSSR